LLSFLSRVFIFGHIVATDFYLMVFKVSSLPVEK